MPITAFSTHYGRELDAEQLLELLRGDRLEVVQNHEEISPKIRKWILGDIKCSSCGSAGAHIVRAAKGRSSGPKVRQSHFRFLDPDGSDAHHRFCEFSPLSDEGDEKGIVHFSKARSQDTRYIANLVCKGIENQVFNQASIRGMRQWFFDLKVGNRVKIIATSNVVDWMEQLYKHQSYHRRPFHPIHAEMPDFDWHQAAKYQFTEDNCDLFDWLLEQRKKLLFSSDFQRARVLADKYFGQEVFDVSVLQTYYKKTVDLAIFVAENSDFPSKSPSLKYRVDGAPAFLLALCAVLLFVSEWEMQDAIGLFAELIKAPEPNDLRLGNVIGLNPFHDYRGWQTLLIASELRAHSQFDADYHSRLAEIELQLRQMHEQWRA